MAALCEGRSGQGRSRVSPEHGPPPVARQGRGPVANLRGYLAPFAKTALLRSGGYEGIRRLSPSRHVAILRYHAVCGEEGYAYADPGICITPAAFAEHARYLAAHYAVLPMPEVVERMRNRRALPPNCVVITFDDGYADNLAAARTLERHGLTATFFITAGCLAGGAPFWPAEVRTLVAAVNEPALTLTLDGAPLHIAVDSPEDRARAVRTLNKLFKSHPIPVRENLRDQLRAAAASPAAPSPCMLRWDEVAEMHRLGMTIGAHTLTHPNLPSAGLEPARQEITGSKARLERELGCPVTMFSYPNGGAERYYTPDLQRVVEESGFAAAATSQNAFATSESDLYALERVEVEERLEDLVFALEVERFAFRPAAR
jgi:peptidoglycan/xylan/chitin deacetylase (PgdA/CDA1 family)